MFGSKATVADLPTTNHNNGVAVAQGHAYIVQADDSLWIYDGSQWVTGGSIQGPAGADGADGTDGVDGTSGSSGTSGTDGVDGTSGSSGTSGAPSTVEGPPGPEGAPGPQGDSGADGVDGTSGSSGTSGAQGPQGIAGPPGPEGGAGADGTSGSSGTSGATGPAGPAGPAGPTGPAGSGGGATKYLLRLEYDVNENLITGQTNFVNATGFSTAGATIVAQVAGGGNSGHTVTLNFSETNPPVSIVGYGWSPTTGNYAVTHYDRDTNQATYEVGLAAFTNQATVDGGSGEDGQWSGDVFTGAQNYNILLNVDQPTLLYANAVPGAFGNPTKLPHAYLVLTF